jgi:hypothetical protein
VLRILCRFAIDRRRRDMEIGRRRGDRRRLRRAGDGVAEIDIDHTRMVPIVAASDGPRRGGGSGGERRRGLGLQLRRIDRWRRQIVSAEQAGQLGQRVFLLCGQRSGRPEATLEFVDIHRWGDAQRSFAHSIPLHYAR